MARPRNFDPDEVLGRAREVFWQKGFQGTSLDDITEATGLNKPSLYAAFGDKNALFLKVLDRYHAYIVENAERIINEGPSARDAIEGCLSVNASVDCAGENKEVRKRVAAFNRKLELLLRDRLRADRTQFSDQFDPDAVAHTIIAIYQGLMVLAKDAPEAARVRAALDQTMKLLV